MDADDPNAPAQAHPSSSPLSSVRDVELSDASQFEEPYRIGSLADAGVQHQSQADHPAVIGPRVSERPSHSDSASRDKEDESAGHSAVLPNTSGEEVPDEGTTQNLAANEESPSGVMPTRRMPKREKKIVIKPSPKKAPRKSVWTTERLLTDTKSPLIKADLRSILANPMAWDLLDAASQAEILALFPHKSMVQNEGTENARPDVSAMMNDDTFRGDCAAYTDNIFQGRHDPDWLMSAYQSHERRKMGEFDEFQVQKVQDDWGVQLPENFKPRRPEQAPCATSRQKQGEDEEHNGVAMNASSSNDGPDEH